MLKVQEFLRSGKTLEDLTNEFGIKVTHHETKSLVILNYCQIDSHKFKFHPIVRECRALTLEKDSWNCIGRGFFRFFNLGEDPESESFFNWNEVYCQEKCDGSLILLYKYNGEICINTRGSFAQGNPHPEFDFTWEQLFWMTGISREEVKVHLKDFETWVFELCSPYNKVVRKYEKPTAYLLGGFRNDIPNKEIGQTWLDMLAENIGAKRPLVYKIRYKENIHELLKIEENKDKTFEGFVVRDWNNRRIKVKSASYILLHKTSNNHNIDKEEIVKLILDEESDEFLNYFSEYKEKFNEYSEKIEKICLEANEVYKNIKDIVIQKDFAINACKYPFSSILFTMRKTNENDAKTLIQNNHKMILRLI